MVLLNGASDIITALTKYYESLSVHREFALSNTIACVQGVGKGRGLRRRCGEEMLSMTSAGSAFKPYYRPDQLLVAMPETKPLRKLYSDPEPAASSPSENGGTKGRRKRTTFTQQQATILEREYLTERYMVRDKRTQLAESLGLSEAQVKTWFQNRRAKDKREKKSGDSPQRSSSDSANVSVADESVLENSLSSSLMSPSPSAEPVTAATPPPQLKPATSPTLRNYQVLSGLLQGGRSLPEYSQYFISLGLASTTESTPTFPPTPVIKTEPVSTDNVVKDIYKMPTNIYEQSFSSIYPHAPFSFSPVTSSISPGYVPEPLAPVANDDTLAAEHKQLTVL
ncbi:Homeobox domain-containing protein [Trichostrongylus colubriformis]|uniref:Homeobox domain-containing protein n=1 Tax=Trichostrongylus colubriformis TaxID=6319 RepID=A0AAN8IXE2_TRICO